MKGLAKRRTRVVVYYWMASLWAGYGIAVLLQKLSLH